MLLATAFSLALAASSAAAAPQINRGVARASGTFVFACSGCPQNRSGTSLFVVAANGRGFRELVHSQATAGRSPTVPAPYHPRWSPRAPLIAFSNRFSEIWTVDAATGKTRRLTRAVTESDDDPAWSPDGRRLVFARTGALYTMNLQGRISILFHPAKRGFRSPDWSPDGRRVVFDRRGAQLFVVGADGRGLRRLVPKLHARYPRWSPDGKRIAFIVVRSTPAVMVARADGSHAHVVVSRADLDSDVNAAWSPDGKRLAVVISKTFDEQADLTGNQIVTVRLDGSDVRPVVIPQLPLETYSELHGIDWSGSAR